MKLLTYELNKKTGGRMFHFVNPTLPPLHPPPPLPYIHQHIGNRTSLLFLNNIEQSERTSIPTTSILKLVFHKIASNNCLSRNLFSCILFCTVTLFGICRLNYSKIYISLISFFFNISVMAWILLIS